MGTVFQAVLGGVINTKHKRHRTEDQGFSLNDQAGQDWSILLLPEGGACIKHESLFHQEATVSCFTYSVPQSSRPPPTMDRMPEGMTDAADSEWNNAPPIMTLRTPPTSPRMATILLPSSRLCPQHVDSQALPTGGEPSSLNWQ